MEKMFKRTLVGAAVAAAAISGSANAAIELAGDAVQFYGQAAISYQYWSPKASGKDSTVQAEVESRFGLRGTVEFEDLGPDLVWQMESGNAANGGGNDKGQGALGGRDTFIGFAYDGLGSLKYGRQLVASYNYVDWPHTNPGLGNVFDWHNAIGASYQDRANHTLRFDSETFGGFNFQASVSGMEETTDAMVVSVAGSFTTGALSLHAGVYQQGEYKKTEKDEDYLTKNDAGVYEINQDYDTASEVDAGDVSYVVVGGSFTSGPMTFTAGYKMMDNGLTNNSQDAVSVTAALTNDAWLYKLGYAQTLESDKGSDDESTAVTARVMRTLPSAAIYFDIRDYDMLGDDEADDGTRFMLGTEYYF